MVRQGFSDLADGEFPDRPAEHHPAPLRHSLTPLTAIAGQIGLAMTRTLLMQRCSDVAGSLTNGRDFDDGQSSIIAIASRKRRRVRHAPNRPI